MWAYESVRYGYVTQPSFITLIYFVMDRYLSWQIRCLFHEKLNFSEKPRLLWNCKLRYHVHGALHSTRGIQLTL